MPSFLISTTKFAFGFVFGLFFSSASIFSKNKFFYYRLWSSSFLLLLSSSTLSTLKIFKIIIYESTNSYYYTCIECQKKSKRRSSRLVLHIYNILCYINVSINFNWTFLIGQLLQHFNRVCYYYHHNVQSVCVFCHLCSLIACFHFFFSIVSFRPKSILRLRFFFEKKFLRWLRRIGNRTHSFTFFASHKSALSSLFHSMTGWICDSKWLLIKITLRKLDSLYRLAR